MGRRWLAWGIAGAVLLLLFVPVSGVLAPAAAAGPTALSKIPAPVRGTVVNCTSTFTCVYAFHTRAGTGWANTTGSSMSHAFLSIQLPGEAKGSYNLSYSAYIARLNGTYTYWTVGNFLGTDVNSGHVIYGITNTNYTITCVGHSGRGGGCKYVYTTDNGTILVRFTNAQITSTSISCSPTSIQAQGKTSCTVKVINGWKAANIPNGTVRISDGQTGTLSDKGSCTLSKGTCTFVYRASDNTCGAVTLAASYVGNAWYYRSSGSTSIDVYVSGGC